MSKGKQYVEDTFRMGAALPRAAGKKSGMYDPEGTRQQKNVMEDYARDRKKQEELVAKQQAEIDQRQKKLTATQMKFLKSRFSMAGGGSGASKSIASTASGSTAGNTNQQTTKSLAALITGRD